jgi:hypothetical protein
MALSETIIVALLSLTGTAIGSVVGIITSQKLTEYRLKQLEDKVQKHNEVVERTFRLEGRMDEAEHDIRDLKGRAS